MSEESDFDHDQVSSLSNIADNSIRRQLASLSARTSHLEAAQTTPAASNAVSEVPLAHMQRPGANDGSTLAENDGLGAATTRTEATPSPPTIATENQELAAIRVELATLRNELSTTRHELLALVEQQSQATLRELRALGQVSSIPEPHAPESFADANPSVSSGSRHRGAARSGSRRRARRLRPRRRRIPSGMGTSW
jgi:hypothetical protein